MKTLKKILLSLVLVVGIPFMALMAIVMWIFASYLFPENASPKCARGES
jgi:flagellar basal body-associated protein FliL